MGSLSYDRRDLTPRGRVGTDLVFKTRPDRFGSIVAEWNRRGVDIAHAERERNSEPLTIRFEASSTETVHETVL